MIRLFFQRVPVGIRDLSQIGKQNQSVTDEDWVWLKTNLKYCYHNHPTRVFILCGWYKMIQPDGGKDTLDRQVPAQQQLFLILNMFKSMVNILFLK
jgi:hypothetical protein